MHPSETRITTKQNMLTPTGFVSPAKSAAPIARRTTSEATISMALTAVLPYLPGQEAPGVPSIVAAEAAGAEEPKLEGVVVPTAMGKPAKQPVYNGGRNFKWQPSWKN